MNWMGKVIVLALVPTSVLSLAIGADSVNKIDEAGANNATSKENAIGSNEDKKNSSSKSSSSVRDKEDESSSAVGGAVLEVTEVGCGEKTVVDLTDFQSQNPRCGRCGHDDKISPLYNLIHCKIENHHRKFFLL